MTKTNVKTKKATIVRDHTLTVPVSKKNPTGKTIRDRHVRRLPGTDLNKDQILEVFKSYNRKGLNYPTTKKLLDQYKNSDDFDALIAVWIDYFSKKFGKQPLDLNSVKALIASESSFRVDPKGEAKEFIFRDIRQKDLKDPQVAIPLAVRWLYRKQEITRSKLEREPSHEETILEYKGWLKGNSKLRESGLINYRAHYDKLKK